MKIIFFAIPIYMFFIFCSNNLTAQNFEWARKLGGNSDDLSKAIALDKNKNIYTTGSFRGTADFDPGLGVHNLVSQNGTIDIFISKIDSNGNFVWAKSIGGAFYNDVAYNISVDSSENAYFSGFFANTVDFDPGIGVYNLTATGERSVFICKLDSSGNFVWAKSFNNQTNSVNYYSHPYMTLDDDFNVYISDAYLGTMDANPDTSVFNLVGGPQNVFVCKLNSDGQFIWAKSFGGFECYGITVDNLGNVCSTGWFFATKDFDPDTTIVFNLTAQGSGTFYILKLNNNGIFEWAKAVDGGYFTFPYAIATDSANNVLISGTFKDTTDFNPDVGVYNLAPISSTANDIFILKLDAFGDFIWAKSIGGTSQDKSFAMDIDMDGNVYTTGYFFGTVDFDPNAGIYNLISINTYDVFISKLDAAGNFVWAKNMGGMATSGGMGIVIDSDNSVYTTGYFYGTVDFDPNSGIYNLTATGSNADIFIHKMSQSLPTTITKIENTLDISIYPNPAQEQITIEIAAEDMPIFGYNLIIVDLLGRVVLSENAIKDNQYQVNIANIPNGQYAMALRDKSGTILTRKLIEILR